MSEILSRRKVIAGLGSLGVVGGTGFFAREVFANGSENKEKTLDVNLYVTQNTLDYYRQQQTGNYHPLIISRKLIEKSIEPFEQITSINISIKREPINLSVNKYNTPTDVLIGFKKRLIDNRRDIADHSNMLFTLTPTRFTELGIATIPDYSKRDPEIPLSCVFKSGLFAQTDRPVTKDSILIPDNNHLYVPVHEFGHNIGLKHKDGVADTESGINMPVGNRKQIRQHQQYNNVDLYSTPMLGGYASEGRYSSSQSSFGEPIPDVEDQEKEIVSMMFNTEIDLNHLLG